MYIHNGVEYDDFEDFATAQADPVRCIHNTIIYSPITGESTPCAECENGDFSDPKQDWFERPYGLQK